MSSWPVVLVAEDDEALRKMIGHFLSDIAEVHLAPDGAAALQWLQSRDKAPDLLITDLMMPGLDGLTLVQQMRKDDKLKRTPVIMLTAKDRPTDVVTGINAGAKHYITKPFKRDDLVNRVKKVLRLD